MPHERPTDTNPRPAAQLTGVVKRYGAVTALDHVDLELRQGEVTALLGPNGAGKTTAVRCFLGLTRVDAGEARVFGGDPLEGANRMRTGTMMQVSSVPDTLKVREHIALFASYYPHPLSIDRVVSAAGLDGLEDRLYGKLSGGQKQRLLFALAIVGDPDLLFLDEPTVGLDVAARRAFWEQIREMVLRGRTVLLTTHYLEEADALADRVVVIDRGRIVADGSPDEIKSQALSRRIRCRTSVPVAEIANLPGVRSVDDNGLGVEILTPEAEALVRRLLELDPNLADLEVSSPGLEEAFLHLTSNHDPGHGIEFVVKGAN